MDLENYNPVCNCGWRIPNDVYYQIKGGIIYELEFNVSTHAPTPKFTNLEVYPKYAPLVGKDGEWIETHYCPTCEREYEYIIPMIDTEAV